jgi:hypothetical protein
MKYFKVYTNDQFFFTPMNKLMDDVRQQFASQAKKIWRKRIAKKVIKKGGQNVRRHPLYQELQIVLAAFQVGLNDDGHFKEVGEELFPRFIAIAKRDLKRSRKEFAEWSSTEKT